LTYVAPPFFNLLLALSIFLLPPSFALKGSSIMVDRPEKVVHTKSYSDPHAGKRCKDSI